MRRILGAKDGFFEGTTVGLEVGRVEERNVGETYGSSDGVLLRAMVGVVVGFRLGAIEG